MLLGLFLALQVVTTERVMEVRVHGNHTTPNAEILALVGDVIGQPATDTLIAAIADRLDRSRRFVAVDVRKRYRSIENPDDVVVMIVVDERPGVGAGGLMPGPWDRVTQSGMWAPVLNYADGYGFTYGARLTFVDLGFGTRLSTPYTWGGERQAQAEVERSFERGPVSRVAVAGGITRRENPRYGIGDTRTGARARVEGNLRRWLRVGGSAGVADVDFGGADDRLTSAGVDAALDTRVDPTFPRNAVFAAIKWERVGFTGHAAASIGGAPGARRGSFSRTTTDVHAYVGVVRSSVLALRGTLVSASAPPPPYEQALLGGAARLRGYDLGYRAGDNLAAASAELRVPLTSPFNIGRVGVKAFADWGTVYPVGATLARQAFDAGYGVGIFATAAVLSLGLDVALTEHGDYKLHFLMGVKAK
jgi:outer membrane protein assembly factor BamA